MPSKKKYNARFPPARIKKIMQTDEDVGKVAAPVPVLISKALEIFLESLITKSSHQTQARSAKTMTTAHIKQCIQSESTFDFLKDLVENVPDIAQGEEEEETENNHASVPVASNHRHTERETTGISRSSSTASSSSLTEAPQKRRRGRPRKQRPEDEAGPSQQRRSQVVQSSEERTTSEESDLSESESTDNRHSSLSQSIPSISISQPKTSQDSRQRQHAVHISEQASQQHQQQHQQQQPAFGIPIMPRFQVPTAPSNVPSASVGMGLYQMPTAPSTGDDDEEDDYDT